MILDCLAYDVYACTPRHGRQSPPRSGAQRPHRRPRCTPGARTLVPSSLDVPRLPEAPAAPAPKAAAASSGEPPAKKAKMGRPVDGTVPNRRWVCARTQCPGGWLGKGPVSTPHRRRTSTLDRPSPRQIRPTSANLAGSSPNSTGIGPNSVDVALNLADFGRIWPKSGRNRPNLGQLWSIDVCQICSECWSKVGPRLVGFLQFRTNFGGFRACPKSDRIRLELYRLGPLSAQLRPSLVRMRPRLEDVDWPWSDLGNNWAAVLPLVITGEIEEGLLVPRTGAFCADDPRRVYTTRWMALTSKRISRCRFECGCSGRCACKRYSRDIMAQMRRRRRK